MVRVLIEVGLPILLAVAIAILKVVFNLRRPAPIAFGCIIPKVCAVSALEVTQYGREAEEQEGSVADHLRRLVHRKHVQVYWIYLRQMSCNTELFQRAVLFEKNKIDQRKFALDYEQREVLILELVGETTKLRSQLMREQAGLLAAAVFGFRIDHDAAGELLRQYKQLEQDIIALAGMGEDMCFRDMLIERLGLTGWQIIPGGAPSPEEA